MKQRKANNTMQTALWGRKELYYRERADGLYEDEELNGDLECLPPMLYQTG
jgi:hypothetical protein